MATATGKISSRWWLIGLGGLGGTLGFLSAWRRARTLVEPVIETRLHVVGKRGVVEASPKGLARAAGVSLEQYALASAMQSEEYDDRGRLAVGRAAWNAAKGKRSRILKLLLPHGKLGQQGIASSYAATSKPPTARTLDLAAAIIENRVPDFVEGAVQWDAPATQDRLHALWLKDPLAYPKYQFDSRQIAQQREAGGARMVLVPGVPRTRFWTYQQVSLSGEGRVPRMFQYTAYRLPTNADLDEIHACNLSSDQVLSGFVYTIVGKGITNRENIRDIVVSIDLLNKRHPDARYQVALEKAKKLIPYSPKLA